MTFNPSSFRERKAIELVLYVAKRLRHPTLHSVFKLLYFSDKLHLEKYGRLILNDGYVAMKHGPVPSDLYNMLKSCRSAEEGKYKDVLQFKDTYNIIPQREANLDFISKSEIECLDNAITKYGKMSFKQLSELSHDAAWKSADVNDFISIEDIAATLPNSKDLLEHLRNPHGD